MGYIYIYIYVYICAWLAGAKMVAGAVDLAVFFQSVAKAFFTEALGLMRRSKGEAVISSPVKMGWCFKGPAPVWFPFKATKEKGAPK